MYEKAVKENIKVYEEYLVLSIVKSGTACAGIIALNIRSGEILSLSAEAVIMATGGYGRIYSKSTNAIINTGSGMAAAYRAGVPLKDLEFVQFHPPSLYGTNILMTEGARGEGGYLYNNKGERFVKELAPRDIVARSIQTEINEGRGFDNAYVLLDLRHLGKKKIIERLPGIRDICIHFAGLDPVKTPIPIQPGQHYSMGGIDANANGATLLPGLFAAGEAACVSVHGGNRLGGNSLLETIVFGKRSGHFAAEYVKQTKPAETAALLGAELERVKAHVARLVDSTGRENPVKVRNELKEIMTDNAGIFREQKKLAAGLNKVRELKERYRKIYLLNKGKKFNLDLVRNLELEGKLELAEVIVLGALNRQESRGSHFRTDYPSRDDGNWLKHTLAGYTESGPKMDYRAVTITRFKPEARTY
jgi:succinate dehydrogenase / fumarate reductase flavoprotein subunit